MCFCGLCEPQKNMVDPFVVHVFFVVDVNHVCLHHVVVVVHVNHKNAVYVMGVVHVFLTDLFQ